MKIKNETKKSIGIITFFRPINYGAVLQALSSEIVLKKMGYNPELIDYRFKRIEKYRHLFQVKEYLGFIKKPLTFIKRVGGDLFFFPQRFKQKSNFNRFINDKLNITNSVFNNIDELRTMEKEYYALIVGSDLVWSPEMTDGLDPVCFLDFLPNNTHTIKIAYAPSIGEPQILMEYKNLYSKYLNNFDRLSVREDATRQVLSRLTDKEICHVLDPSLLTTISDWEEYEKTIEEYSHGEYILSFMLEYSPLLIDSVCKLHDMTGYRIVSFDLKKYYGKRPAKSMIHVGPDQFLSLIKNASYVVTNSFHGCAFSLIYQKNFWCIPHTKRGIRMTELMDSIGLSNRIVKDGSDMDCESIIDYTYVDKKLEVLRKNSMDYLFGALNDE